MSRTPAELLAYLQALADRTDEIELRHFRSATLRVERKADSSPVTEADRAVESLVREETRSRFPEFGILGEEEGTFEGTSDTRLILDPIDGTKNFMRGIPIFATLLAIETAGEVVAGVVSAPALGSRWHAVRGGGAYRGDRRLRVSRVGSVRESQIFHGGLKDASGAILGPGWSALFSSAERTRGFGDFYQHVLVAEGAGELAYDPRVKPWDIAPLLLLVEEAGGRATSLAGARTIEAGHLVSSNGTVHEEALARLTGGRAPATNDRGTGESSVRIRPYDDPDEDAVVALWDRCGLLRPWNDPRKDIARKKRVQPELFLVGLVGGAVVATVMAGYDGHRGWVNYLAVDPEHRRRGLGRVLMAEVERGFRALGCPKMSLQIRRDNPEAIAFYERLGFTDDDVVSFGKRLEFDDR